MHHPTTRFSDRVDNYVRYRPGYPKELVPFLSKECSLTRDSAIAEIGSGTGILARHFLENGNKVFGVEPNEEMRAAGERLLAEFPGFCSIDGAAESTTLDESSLDIVIAAQAAHWFEPEQARREFTRILKPSGWAVLVWNERATHSTPFLAAYEQLLQSFGTDYKQVQAKVASTVKAILGPSPARSKVFENEQEFDYEGLKGRLLSSSYTPKKSDANFEPMINELRRIFELHQVNGQVTFEYDTKVFYGHF